MNKRIVFLMVLALGLSLAATCFAGPMLRMATTTSTANTGLLDYLAPKFQKDTGIELQFVAVGTGKALKMGANCDVDVLMVHAPAAEKKFVADGHGKDRKEIMYNDFVIIGPKNDPAGVKGMKVTPALKQIAAKNAVFASRGDDSGTHKKERSLWKAAGLKPEGSWYIETGQGMLKTVIVAQEKGGYTMVDRGTYIKYSANAKGNPDLLVLVEGDKILFNQYSVMLINPEKCSKVKVELAKKFSDWITSEPVQKQIADFRLLGMELFKPNAK
jgi:tungstate transport system substrate-binding protein